MKYALIAGGSKGIGFAIAHALAKRGYNLLLIARHADKLSEAKSFFERNYSITVHTLSFDLSKPETAKEITNFCVSNNLPVEVLCNVAGLGGANDYLSLPLHDIRYMIHLNLESQAALTYHMLSMQENNKLAYILNVGSLAGFGPIPVKNMYSATKAGVIFFSRALRSQLEKRNISVSCLCPGPVFTKPEIEKDTKEKLGWLGNQMAVDPAKVGEIAVRNMFKRKFMIIPGFTSKLMAFFVRILPDSLLVSIYENMIEKSESKSKNDS